jgi:hypothetical protein
MTQKQRCAAVLTKLEKSIPAMHELWAQLHNTLEEASNMPPEGESDASLTDRDWALYSALCGKLYDLYNETCRLEGLGKRHSK